MTGMEAHQPESLRRVERWGVVEQTITEREGQPSGILPKGVYSGCSRRHQKRARTQCGPGLGLFVGQVV